MSELLRLSVNGLDWAVAVEPEETLAELLRERLGLRGTRLGCEQGVCGACTVLLDGEPVRSCLVLALQAQGREVETVEGLADDPAGRRVIAEFVRHRAYQCGFCTAGFEMLGVWKARAEAELSEEQARALAASNLCRCTGYRPIVAALRAASREEAPAASSAEGPVAEGSSTGDPG